MNYFLRNTYFKTRLILVSLLVTSLFVFSLTLSNAIAAPDQDSTNLSEQATTTDDVEKLIEEAQTLFAEQRPIDARAKLQQALQIAPKDYRVHLLLGAYYLSEVSHFQLAYKYLTNAEELFSKQYGSDIDGTLDFQMANEHAKLLYLLSEARLNLDDYKGALDTLDRFGRLYWAPWYPGTKAWVLMKLKNIDEAIKVAQTGLMQNADLSKTYNILGILFSVINKRELALQAFAQALQEESLLGSSGYLATPLNNVGEVYREMFLDPQAEAAWTYSVSLPDGCEHILTSLNLAILYIDELRLFQAERILSDFEACFQNNSTVRKDTEHRALIKLGRGKIELRKGNTDAAIDSLALALERQQWFGKIGTDENDLKFAALTSMAQALDAKAITLKDTFSDTWKGWFSKKIEITWYEIRAWWHNRQARIIALDKLNNFEDINIRNTDAMLEYPTLGRMMSRYTTSGLTAHITKTIQSDDRSFAHAYYHLYLGSHLISKGQYGKGLKEIQIAQAGFRDIDRLAQAEALLQEITARKKINNRNAILRFWKQNPDYHIQMRNLIEELYTLLPSHVRYGDLSLPISIVVATETKKGARKAMSLKKRLLKTRFQSYPAQDAPNAKYTLLIREQKEAIDSTNKTITIVLQLVERQSGLIISEESGLFDSSRTTSNEVELVNKFINNVFSHHVDPIQRPLPKLKILESIF